MNLEDMDRTYAYSVVKNSKPRLVGWLVGRLVVLGLTAL